MRRPLQSEQPTPGRREPPVLISPFSACSCRSRPFFHLLAAANRTRHPSGSSERRCCCLSPWRFTHCLDERRVPFAAFPCSAWERWPCRSAVRFAARPLMRSHGDRGNEKTKSANSGRKTREAEAGLKRFFKYVQLLKRFFWTQFIRLQIAQ